MSLRSPSGRPLQGTQAESLWTHTQQRTTRSTAQVNEVGRVVLRRRSRFCRSRPCSKSQRPRKTPQRGLAGANNDAGSQAFSYSEVEKEIFGKRSRAVNNQHQAKSQHQFSVVHFQHQMPAWAPSTASWMLLKSQATPESAVSKTARRKPNSGQQCPTDLHVGPAPPEMTIRAAKHRCTASPTPSFMSKHVVEHPGHRATCPLWAPQGHKLPHGGEDQTCAGNPCQAQTLSVTANGCHVTQVHGG